MNRSMRLAFVPFVTLFAAAAASAQSPAVPGAQADAPKAAPASAPEPDSRLAQLAWLEGCWRGSVNKREFREHWLPLRGNLMVGASHTVVEGKTQDYEYLRLEPRADGVYYVTTPPGQRENSFRLSDVASEGDAQTFTFANTGDTFPQRLMYRRASEGWLYAQVDGKLNGEERKVIYPMRRIDCQSGDLIRK
jgi:uncharacterized protein DUF6265